jgi:23S rRNA (cytosine1962-C5)-methyltransferase
MEGVIRWLVEDAMKFMKREERRGNKYHGIILDPPAYGRGPEGEKWLLSEHLNEMLRICKALLHPEQNFFLLNIYSVGFSAVILDTLVSSHFGNVKRQIGELVLDSKTGQRLPLGTFVRF